MLAKTIINKIENEGFANTNRTIHFTFGKDKEENISLFIKSGSVSNAIPLNIKEEELSLLYWNLYENIKKRYNNNSSNISVSISEKVNLANTTNPFLLIEFNIHSNLVVLKLDNKGLEKDAIEAIKNDFLNLVNEKKSSKSK